MTRTRIRRRGKYGDQNERMRNLALGKWYRRAARLGHFVANNPARSVIYCRCTVCDRWGMIEKLGALRYRGLSLVVGHGEAKSTTPERRMDFSNVGPLCPRDNQAMETDRALERRFQVALAAGEPWTSVEAAQVKAGRGGTKA